MHIYIYIYISKYFFTYLFEFFPMLEFKDKLKTCFDIDIFWKMNYLKKKNIFKKLYHFLVFDKNFNVS